MIILNKNSNNTFTIDAYSLRADFTDPTIYYFEFINDQQRELFEITLTDVSPFIESYNTFELDLTTELPNMVYEGDYEYKVYDTSDKDNLVAIGKMTLKGTPRANSTNEITTGNNDIYEDK